MLIAGASNPDSAAAADALRFLMHLVGDAHQPLHNITNDRGATVGKAVMEGFVGGWRAEGQTDEGQRVNEDAQDVAQQLNK